jgi:hypothetical protein
MNFFISSIKKRIIMYRLLAFSIIFSAAVGFAAPAPTNQAQKSKAIIGHWVASKDGKNLTLDLEANGDSILGEGSKTYHGNYTINWSVKPHQLTVTNKSGESLRTIFEFMDGGTLRTMEFKKNGNKFPKDFSKKNDIMIFKKTR